MKKENKNTLGLEEDMRSAEIVQLHVLCVQRGKQVREAVESSFTLHPYITEREGEKERDRHTVCRTHFMWDSDGITQIAH